jgi:hypothetical protein
MKYVCALSAFLCLAIHATAQQSSGNWTGWRYSVSVELTSTDSTTLVRAAIPRWITARAREGFEDLRVVDDAGTEVAYVLHARREVRERREQPAKLLEVTFAPGDGTQGIVDLGTDARVHNSIEIQSAESDFFAWVELAISPDSRSWRVLRDRAPIYRFRRENLDGNRLIRYGDSQSRYLRVRVLEPARRFALDGVSVWLDQTVEAERTAIEAAFVADATAPRQQTWWKADLGSALYVSEIRFAVNEPEFYRALRVSASNNGQHWWTAGSGDIFRIAQRERNERLNLPIAETRARYWRVEVLDRSDPPLPGLHISLFATRRYVVFRQQPRRTYRLLYGNENAPAPQYSLARLLNATDIESASPATIGSEGIAPAAPAVIPWTERHGYALWVAVGAAVAALAVLAVRALRM